jgi:hypothetical protein
VAKGIPKDEDYASQNYYTQSVGYGRLDHEEQKYDYGDEFRVDRHSVVLKRLGCDYVREEEQFDEKTYKEIAKYFKMRFQLVDKMVSHLGKL